MDVQRGAGWCSRREAALWQEGNYASLVCRESTRVTVTRSLGDPGVLLPHWEQPSTRNAMPASGAACQGRQHPGISTGAFHSISEAQVSQARGTIQHQQLQQQSQSSSSSAGQEQMCFYGAATPRLHDAPGCTVSPVCTHSQGFHITESGCCTVCSSSNIQDGLKIGCALLWTWMLPY